MAKLSFAFGRFPLKQLWASAHVAAGSSLWRRCNPSCSAQRCAQCDLVSSLWRNGALPCTIATLRVVLCAEKQRLQAECAFGT